MLGERVADLPNVDVRAAVLGHIVRGGRPTYRDRMIAGRLSLGAITALLRDRSDVMAAWRSTGTTSSVAGALSLRWIDRRASFAPSSTSCRRNGGCSRTAQSTTVHSIAR